MQEKSKSIETISASTASTASSTRSYLSFSSSFLALQIIVKLHLAFLIHFMYVFSFPVAIKSIYEKYHLPFRCLWMQLPSTGVYRAHISLRETSQLGSLQRVFISSLLQKNPHRRLFLSSRLNTIFKRASRSSLWGVFLVFPVPIQSD